MPWHWEPTKDVTSCDKLRGGANSRNIRRFPNGETPLADEDVEEAIASILRDNRVHNENGNEPIADGDVVYVFYKGYLEETGKTFTGGSNIGGDAAELEIGSDTFIPGFEDNIIGKVPADYSSTAPMIIEATFPEKYPQDPDLAGKSAWFEVYVEVKEEKYRFYKVPTLTDAFVGEVLGFTDEQLSEYDGVSMAEKYQAYVREALTWADVDVSYYVEKIFRTSVLTNAVVKKYPERQLKEYCDREINRLQEEYNTRNLSTQYNTFDNFMCSQYGLTYGSDWKGEVEKGAKLELAYDLILYHVMNVEGIKPSEEEYSELLLKYLDAELEKNGITPEAFSQFSEYESQREMYRAKMTLEYGKEYFREKIYKSIIFEMIINNSTIVEITE